MARATAHSLSIAEVSKRYGRVVALDRVSLEVPRGEFITFLGPSGSGKTTLLMAIAGFTEPTSGEILVDGRPITHLPPERRNFGMVFQGYALFPHMTVAENVAFPLVVRRTDRAETARRVRETLDQVQLGHLADRRPRQLSGGQQQRVALARALVFAPDILLLDEPLSALDKKLRKDLQVELKALHQRVGHTFIYVTHDQEEALSLSDRIAIIRDGRIMQEGPPGELYDRPRSVFVADFLGKSNFLAGTVEGERVDGLAYRVGARSFLQAPDGVSYAAGQRITLALRPEKIALSAEEPASAPNRAPGRIVGWGFFGASFDIRVETDGLGEIAVQAPAWRTKVEPAEGREVWVHWDPAASVPVTES